MKFIGQKPHDESGSPRLGTPESGDNLEIENCELPRDSRYLSFLISSCIALAILSCCLAGSVQAQILATSSDPNAQALAVRTMERLAHGDAFDATLRQRIWVAGREVPGVGYYEQSGGGSGRYCLEMTIHDGDSRQTMKQISDGKLAWQRSQIAGVITIRRIDLGRIDEYEQESVRKQNPAGLSTSSAVANHLIAHSVDPPTADLPARLRAGGLVELLDQITADYELRLSKARIEKQPVWILRGTLKEAARARIQKAAGGEQLAALCPIEVRVAISATADANGFGAGLPVLIEFWSAPPVKPTSSVPVSATPVSAAIPAETAATAPPAGRLISSLELYSMRRIQPSPEERFRFTSEDREVNFTNDTHRYLERIDSRTANRTVPGD